ncbi:unnamed protein product [Prunus armeniaca]
MSDTALTDGTGASGSQPALWPTTLVTSFGPIALCNESLGRSCLTRCGRRCSDSYSLLRGTSNGRATCTTIFSDLMIRRSLFRRVARRSWRGRRIAGHGSAKWAKANKGNRNKKTLLHHSGGSKFQGIDVFGDVYVRASNELAESLHAMMLERSQMVLHESASQLPPDTPLGSVDPPQDAGFQTLTETLDQTLGRRPGTYCRGMGNARWREPVGPSSSQSNQVTALTAEVAELKTQLASYSTQMAQMSQLLASIVRSSIPVPTVGPSSTSNSI